MGNYLPPQHPLRASYMLIKPDGTYQTYWDCNRAAAEIFGARDAKAHVAEHGVADPDDLYTVYRLRWSIARAEFGAELIPIWDMTAAHAVRLARYDEVY